MGQLEDFYAQHGRLPKSTSPDTNEADVASYMIHTLRRLIVRGSINSELAARAAAIPGVVDFRRNPDQDERLKQLEDFIDEHGHLPHSRAARAGSLYDWMVNTVVGDPGVKSASVRERHLRVAQLIRSTPTVTVYRWRAHLSEIEALCAEHGHRPIRLPSLQSHQEVNRWFLRVSEVLEHGDFDEVTAARVRKVLSFPTAQEHTWRLHFAGIRAFAAAHGRPPRGFHEDGYAWLSRQRHDFEAGRLSPEHLEMLSGVDGLLPTAPKRAAA